jgi:hypothetical protein
MAPHPAPVGGHLPSAGTGGLLSPEVPTLDAFGRAAVGTPTASTGTGRSESLPGLLPGLPPAPAPDPHAPIVPAPDVTRRSTADRHKILVDRRLLLAVGGLMLVLVIVFGVLTFTGGGGHAAAAQSTGAGADSSGSGVDERSTGNPRDILRSMLNPTVMTGCTTPARSDSAYADATLNCRSASGMQVSAFHFPNRSAVDRQIGARETYYYDEGNCDDGQQSSERWSTASEKVGGNRLCYFFANRFYEFWTYDDKLVAFSADDADAGRLNAWWRSFDPLRH